MIYQVPSRHPRIPFRCHVCALGAMKISAQLVEALVQFILFHQWCNSQRYFLNVDTVIATMPPNTQAQGANIQFGLIDQGRDR